MKRKKYRMINAGVLCRQGLPARISAMLACLMIAVCLLIFTFIPAQAHDDEKQKTTSASTIKGTPFSFTLPGSSNKYTEIMKPPITVHMKSGLVQLTPGQDVGLHSTKQNEEMLIFLEGQGEVEMEGYVSLPVNGGQTAYVPPETKHNVRNTGSIPLKYIFIVSKAINN